MKRSVLIPIDETSEKKTADEIIAEAFGVTHSPRDWRQITRMAQLTFFWQESETVLEVVSKLSFVETVEDAESAADYIRRHTGLPLKELPRERDY